MFIFNAQPTFARCHIQAGYNYSETQSNLPNSPATRMVFTHFAHAFNISRAKTARKNSQNDNVAMPVMLDTIIELEAAPEAERYCSAKTDANTPVGMAAKSVIVATQSGGKPNT